jgi:outer membrane immunogenic protein
MRRTALALLGIFGIGSVSGASAADLAARPVVKAPPAAVVTVYNWSGFYIGAHVGYAQGNKDWFDDDSVSPRGSHDVSGLVAGGQLGFNWQTGNWVLGIEGQASWSNADGEHFWDPGSFTVGTDVRWLGTIAGRLGYAFDRVLVYAKGGAAFVHDEHDFVEGLDTAEGEKTRWGWMVGGGIEVAVVGNWSVKGEYNYMDFGKKAVAFVDPTGVPAFTSHIDQHLHVVKFGINYRFGPSPVVARY